MLRDILVQGTFHAKQRYPPRAPNSDYAIARELDCLLSLIEWFEKYIVQYAFGS